MNPDYGEARFCLAAIVIVSTIIMRLLGYLDEGHYVQVIAISLGLYSAHSLADDKIRDAK